MKTYRCYFLDQNSRVRAFRIIGSASDNAAITVAANLLKENSYSGVELWHREHWVAQWQNGLEQKCANGGQETPFEGHLGVPLEAPAAPERVTSDNI